MCNNKSGCKAGPVFLPAWHMPGTNHARLFQKNGADLRPLHGFAFYPLPPVRRPYSLGRLFFKTPQMAMHRSTTANGISRYCKSWENGVRGSSFTATFRAKVRKNSWNR